MSSVANRLIAVIMFYFISSVVDYSKRDLKQTDQRDMMQFRLESVFSNPLTVHVQADKAIEQALNLVGLNGQAVRELTEEIISDLHSRKTP